MDAEHEQAIDRLLTMFPGWTIQRVAAGRGLTAHHKDGRRLYGADTLELLLKLDAANVAEKGDDQ